MDGSGFRRKFLHGERFFLLHGEPMETSSHSRTRAHGCAPHRVRMIKFSARTGRTGAGNSRARRTSAYPAAGETRAASARNLRQTVSVSSTIFSTDTAERMACFSRGQSSTWMVRTSPTLGPLITARAPGESGSQPRRYHGMVEENAGSVKANAPSARFSPSTDATAGVAIVERQFTVRN